MSVARPASPAVRAVLAEAVAVWDARRAVKTTTPGTPEAEAALRAFAELLVTFHADRAEKILSGLVRDADEAMLRVLVDALESGRKAV